MFLNKHGFVGRHKTSQAGHDFIRHHQMKTHNEAMKILLPLPPLLPCHFQDRHYERMLTRKNEYYPPLLPTPVRLSAHVEAYSLLPLLT